MVGLTSTTAAASAPAHTSSGSKKRGRKAGFPSEYRRLAPIQKLAWLAAVAPSLVSSGRIQRSQIEAQKRELRRESTRVARIVPTPQRLEEFENGYAFPPKADDPACQMREADITLNRCEEEVLWPANYLSIVGKSKRKLATFDVVCARTERLQKKLGLGQKMRLGWASQEIETSSPSAASMAAAADGQISIVESKLAPEDEQSLRAEIQAYQAAAGGAAAPVEFKFV